MADKSFGVKDINLIGASGTPEIESPNNLNIKATNVAISTDMSVGGELTVTDTFLKPHAVGLGTTDATGRDAGISTATGTVIYDSTVGIQVYSGDEGGWRTVGGAASGVFLTETTFPHAPLAPQPYIIPSSATQLDIYAFGAGGGGRAASGTGGGGGFAQMTIPVASLGTLNLTVVVGEGGPAPGTETGVSYPNGAFGGGGNQPASSGLGGGGGGYSGVFAGPVTQGNAIIIAGGGGGGGYPGSHGGQGGGTPGGTGTGTPTSLGGGGGTQLAGGAVGSPNPGSATAGTALKGGSGPTPSTNGCSGGGGYYGGGGGTLGPVDGGGGGGSGYVSPNAVTSERISPANSGGANAPNPAPAGSPSPFHSAGIGLGGSADNSESSTTGGPGYVVIRSYT